MKTLNLTPYDIPTAEGTTAPYPVRDMLMNVLFVVPNIKARELLARNDLMRRIRDAKENSIELSEPEVLQLVSSFEAAQGFNRNDIELVSRVLALAPERT